MAVVVWVYSGGGEAEVSALIPFLQRVFPKYQFERKLPAKNKPGPKANRPSSYGRTGKSLIEQIKERLPDNLQKGGDNCECIFIFDDLDCRDPELQKEIILKAISKINIDREILIGFASPEIEAWIIADWGNSIAKHPDFRKQNRHRGMEWWLSASNEEVTETSERRKRNSPPIPFDAPESFSNYDPDRDCCHHKLSELLIESSVHRDSYRDCPRYSKAKHTPELLSLLDPQIVQQKCPLFREIYSYFSKT